MPRNDTGTQAFPVLGLRHWIEQQLQHRGDHLTRCRCMRKQVLDEITQKLSAHPVRGSDRPERRT